MITDLELAVATLLAKTQYYNTFFAYYEGRQPLVYSNDRLKEVFKGRNARFTENWCAVVVDSVHERIQLRRITVADDDAATKQLDMLLSSSDLLLEADDCHLAALVAGESYMIVWTDEESGEVEAYYNDPRTVHLFYESNSPRKKRFACKWWIDDEGYRNLTLYYPDRFEYYKSKRPVQSYTRGMASSYNEVTSGKSFDEPTSEVNPHATVPVFHFRRDRRRIGSELQNVIEPQDAVNKLVADMMVTAEFGAFKQRWVISNADTSKLKNSPNGIWDIPAGDGEDQATSVGEFDITPLDNYIKAIDKFTVDIAIISRTPKHYFYGQGGDPSGEALIAMEAPLNHKAQKYIDRFTATWSELAAFMLRLAGAGEIDDNAIVPIFDKPETVQPYTQSLIRKESVAAGIPLMWQMEQEGYSEQELADLEDARTEQADQQTERMAQVMEQRASSFAQNGNNNGNGAQQNGQPPRGTRNSA